MRIERRIQRQRAVTVVLESMAFRSSWRQRQQQIDPVECLNRRLLVDAEDNSMLRRVEIETDDICRLRLKVGICRAHVAFQPMRLQASVAPRPGDDGVLHAEFAAQRSRGPMRRAVRRSPTRPSENARLQCEVSAPWASRGGASH